MENKNQSLVNEHVQSLHGMNEAATDEFFYTRLKARMEKNILQQGWNFPLKPAWIIGTLVLLLIVNGFILTQELKSEKPAATISSSSPLQNFVEEFNLGI